MPARVDEIVQTILTEIAEIKEEVGTTSETKGFQPLSEQEKQEFVSSLDRNATQIVAELSGEKVSSTEHKSNVANKLDHPHFWLWRAEEVRTIADDMKDGEPKAIMLRIAEDYERIAKMIEQ